MLSIRYAKHGQLLLFKQPIFEIHFLTCLHHQEGKTLTAVSDVEKPSRALCLAVDSVM
jgi:hypothetical protein